MIAAYAEKLGLPDFLDGLVVGEYRDPDPPAGWVVADVKAASLNPHDTWTLKGQVGYPFEPPVVLGCDGAGLSPDGKDVVFYPVIPTPNGGLRMLTDGVDGTCAPKVAVPAENLVPKPANLSFEEAAGLGTAWLTAYRMLFTKAQLKPGERVLIEAWPHGASRKSDERDLVIVDAETADAFQTFFDAEWERLCASHPRNFDREAVADWLKSELARLPSARTDRA